MKSFDDDWPLAALRAALGNTVVACLAVLLVSGAAGAAVDVAGRWHWPRDAQEMWLWCYLWVFHWVVACLMLWGLPFVAFHLWGLYRLLMTDTDPIAPLLIILMNQTIVSTISGISVPAWDWNERGEWRAAATGVVLVFLAAIALWMDHKRRKTTVLGE